MPTIDNLPAFERTTDVFPPEAGSLRDCKCSTCKFRVYVHSHPWFDGQPVSNIIGYGCAVQLDMLRVGADYGKPMVTMIALTNDIGCELHTPNS